MELAEVMIKRRSIRNYKENTVIEPELVDEMIKAAMLAPTWKNSQTGRYYVIESEEAIKRLREKCLPSFNQKSSANAPVYVITTFVKDRSGFDREGNPENEVGNEWGAYDLGLQNAYFLLKAAELGVDSLVMGIRSTEAIREEFNIPENEEVMAVIALGYAAEAPKQFARKSPEMVSSRF